MEIHFIFLAVVYTLMSIYDFNRNRFLDTGESKVQETRRIPLEKIVLVATFALMVLFLGLRDITIGTDTKTYVSLFRNQNYMFSGFEVLPQVISFLSLRLSKSYHIYLILMQVVVLIGIFYSVIRYKFDSAQFMLLYITSFSYLYSASAIRFFMAFSMILIAFKHMIDEDTMKTIFWVLLASMFHTSALVFIPVYYVSRIRFNNFNVAIITLLLCIVTIVGYFTGFSFIFEIDILSKYGYIMDTRNDIGGLSLIMHMGIIIFFSFYRRHIKTYKKDYDFYIKMQMTALVFDMIGVAHRLVWYFRFPIWFLVPILLKNLKIEKPRDAFFLKILFSVVYIFLYYYLLKGSYPSHNLLRFKFNGGLN